MDILDSAFAAPVGVVIGLTGPPGVGKSTLTGALIRRWRGSGHRVGVIAVDPSSRSSGGALLGDRTRLQTDPEDDGIFVRSMAARERLGGVAEMTYPALVLMRAIFDRVIVETVGVGQSETEIAGLADLVVLCSQPGAGDGVQFMKAGVMEIPDLVIVTKADLGAAARRAVAEISGALSLSARESGRAQPEVIAISAQSGEGLDAFDDALAARLRHLEGRDGLRARRDGQARRWLESAIRTEFGRRGWQKATECTQYSVAESPFAAMNRISLRLDAALNGAEL